MSDPFSLLPALLSGGDSRIEPDPRTGLNKYLCPAMPAPDVICASSCTASPISMQGFGRAARALTDIAGAMSPRQRSRRLTILTEQLKARLLQYFGIGALARVILCPSGTDALLMAAMLVAAERPGETMTAILPSASETGTGVPMAAMCRAFDGPNRGKPLIDGETRVTKIPVRCADGSSRSNDEVNDAFAKAASCAEAGNVVVYLTHGTKTGLIAPVSPPRGTDVIVDACQARIEPETVAAYLMQGWPVVVTGSKFFGGPAFSGALFFPLTRPLATARRTPGSAPRAAARLGTALRWTAAMAAIDAFEPVTAGMTSVLLSRAAAIEKAVASNPALVPIGGLRPRGTGWANLPSIFSIAVRDSVDRGRLLTAAELRPLYERLASMGVLAGQPVEVGRFGGLRIAIGARDLTEGPDDGGLAHVFAALEDVTVPSRSLVAGR